ncbi:MAG: hypothetical protein ABW158_19655 [Candidatus Thiodiazotropha sp. 6PDIVS]
MKQLDDKAKQRLRLEEIYREELRAEIRRSKTTTRSKVWELLNSAFILWILSTIVISGITWAYTSWKETIEKEVQYSDEVLAIDLELAARLQFFDSNLRQQASRNSVLSISTMKTLLSSYDPILTDPIYSQKSTSSLIARLKKLVRKSEVDELDSALDAVKDMQSAVGNGNVPIGTVQESFNKIYLNRWK